MTPPTEENFRPGDEGPGGSIVPSTAVRPEHKSAKPSDAPREEPKAVVELPTPRKTAGVRPVEPTKATPKAASSTTPCSVRIVGMPVVLLQGGLHSLQIGKLKQPLRNEVVEFDLPGERALVHVAGPKYRGHVTVERGDCRPGTPIELPVKPLKAILDFTGNPQQTTVVCVSGPCPDTRPHLLDVERFPDIDLGVQLEAEIVIEVRAQGYASKTLKQRIGPGRIRSPSPSRRSSAASHRSRMRLLACSLALGVAVASPVHARPPTTPAPPLVPTTEVDKVNAAIQAWTQGNWARVRALLEPMLVDGRKLGDPLLEEAALRYLSDATLQDPDIAPVSQEWATGYIKRLLASSPDWRPPADTHSKAFYDLYNSLREERDRSSFNMCKGERAACIADLDELKVRQRARPRSRAAAQGLRAAGGRGRREGRPQPRRRAGAVRRRPLLQRPQGPGRRVSGRRAGDRGGRARPLHHPRDLVPALERLPTRLADLRPPGELGPGAAQRRAGDGHDLPRRHGPRHRPRADPVPPVHHRQAGPSAAQRAQGRRRRSRRQKARQGARGQARPPVERAAQK
ncbi:hypothetical protein OV079_10830 [Nannocystis pusilla]|uniref:Uncharacterized protein n=1 Tax=Nannocystis pusilla TaxID=889268 RepID=A0A9X3ELT8_9BACT|nr:hypothetical protein [Nannocystis pusilla]MCY1006046.1 hypothetical protein [Nannocystis pusilla]